MKRKLYSETEEKKKTLKIGNYTQIYWVNEESEYSHFNEVPRKTIPMVDKIGSFLPFNQMEHYFDLDSFSNPNNCFFHVYFNEISRKLPLKLFSYHFEMFYTHYYKMINRELDKAARYSIYDGEFWSKHSNLDLEICKIVCFIVSGRCSIYFFEKILNNIILLKIGLCEDVCRLISRYQYIEE